MPTGSGKSSLFHHLYSLMRDVRAACNIRDKDPLWVFDDATFEKMGALMCDNSGNEVCKNPNPKPLKLQECRKEHH